MENKSVNSFEDIDFDDLKLQQKEAEQKLKIDLERVQCSTTTIADILLKQYPEKDAQCSMCSSHFKKAQSFNHNCCSIDLCRTCYKRVFAKANYVTVCRFNLLERI